MSGSTLILTSEKILLKTEPRYLLGKWSIDYRASLNEIKTLETITLPYPFDEAEALSKAYTYLQEVDKRLFPQFVNFLNQYHHLQKSYRYWRILVGYWWREFMEIAYERYVCLNQASQRLPQAAVKVMPSADWLTPYDSKDFGNLNKTDRYNHQLYSEIIQHQRWFQSKALTSAEMTLAFSPLPDLQEGWVNRIKQTLCGLSRWNRQYFTSTYLLNYYFPRIAFKLKCFPTLDTPRFFISCDRLINQSKRFVFSTLQGHDDFENVFVNLLPTHIPKVYLEDFSGLSQTVQQKFPNRKMKSITTANGFAYNDGFKLFTAEQVESFNTKFIIIQHGGQYGCAAWHSSEDYEVEIADQYLTYGWKKGQENKIIPFIANRFKNYKKKVTGTVSGKILWVLASFPRYSYTMYAVPVGPQFVDYLNDQAIFIGALPDEVRATLRARSYRYGYGWHDMAYLQQKSGHSIYLSNLKQTLAREATQSRLVVCTYNATAHLEAFVLNVPTILYWNPKHWQLRPEAYELHQRLREVGILYDDPVQAAAKVAKIHADPLTWWKQADIQAARLAFCIQYAATSSNYVSKWYEVLR